MQIRVLIVEDDVLQADDLEALMALQGHRVCGSVRTGEAAVALAKATQPDVVLLDVGLAGHLDGIEAAERIQAVAPCQVVFITAYGDPDSKARMQRTNPLAILAKPADGALLEIAIGRFDALNNAGSPARLQRP